MADLSEEGRRMIEALVKGDVAWQSPAQLADALRQGLDETNDQLATLDVGGWLESWDFESEIVVTLSVLGASRLGLRIVEVGAEQTPRWARPGDAEPPGPKAAMVFRCDRAADLELVVDPSSPPEEAAERADEAAYLSAVPVELRSKAFPKGLPLPTLLIGSGLTPWPGPGDGRKATCPACRSKRLRPSSYCLCCDRWGLDHLLRNEPTPRPRAVPGPKEVAVRRDAERDARKLKRRARMFAQMEADRKVKKPRPRPAS